MITKKTTIDKDANDPNSKIVDEWANSDNRIFKFLNEPQDYT